MKKVLLFSLLLAAVSTGAAEAAPGLTILFKSQEKASFTFASKPVIAVTSEGITVTSTASNAVSYTFAEVQRFYFEDDETDIKSINEDPSAQHPVFSYANGTVSVSGLAAGEYVRVSSIAGGLLSEVKANLGGSASVDLSDVPAGVYVISIGNGVSFKLLKK